MIFGEFLKFTEQPSELEPELHSLSPFVLGSSFEVLTLFPLFVVWSWFELLALFIPSLLRPSAAPLVASLRYETLQK